MQEFKLRVVLCRPCVRSSAERTREGGGGKHDKGADGEPRSVEQTAAALIDSLVCAGVARDTTLLALAGVAGQETWRRSLSVPLRNTLSTTSAGRSDARERRD